MVKVTLDTSFLISLADPARNNHKVALEYFKYCVEHSVAMHLSVISAGEFDVKQSFKDLPLQNFRILPFNLAHALKAAEFHRVLKPIPRLPEDSRTVVANDIKIIAQASEEKIYTLLTEDENTMSRYCARLESSGNSKVKTVLLRDGFNPTSVFPVTNLKLFEGNAPDEDWV